MNQLNCCCRNDCIVCSVVASIILGIVAAMLRFMATITVTPAFLWVVLGVAIVYLAVLLISSIFLRNTGFKRCLCSILPVLLAGILGTVLISIILLAITFVATSVIGAIFTGLLILCFSLIITSTSCLITCITGCSDEI